MSSAWTPLVWIVERTCRIGVGIKAASHGKVLCEDFFTFAEALQRGELGPLLPFFRPVFEFHAVRSLVGPAPLVETGSLAVLRVSASRR